MCGIVGYVGKRQAAPVLLDGLKKLEYRGYDSAGIAVFGKDGVVEICKAKGRLSVLLEKIDGGSSIVGSCGIGHTRWATHGEPSETNAHPHCSDDRNVVLVHNGVVENYAELKDGLQKIGYRFYSQTDTEVAAKLIDAFVRSCGDPIDALSKSMARFRGSYALAILFRNRPGEIYAVKKDSPMIIGESDGELFLASDVPAVLGYTRRVYYMNDFEIARLTTSGVEFFSVDGTPLRKRAQTIAWSAESAEKSGFEHFMLKEIHEQPRAVKDTLSSATGSFCSAEESVFSGLSDAEIGKLSGVYVVACGSAYHAGVAMRYAIERLARLPVRAEIASEFRYRRPVIGKDELFVVVSQSGETADSLAALREAARLGVKTLAVVNVRGSSIAREADYVFYTPAGPEIAVATTKAYSAQLIAGYLLALRFAKARGTLSDGEYEILLGELSRLPEKMSEILASQERVRRFAFEHASLRDAFFIGRGTDYAVCLEGSLKLKEVAYIRSEAYAAGELKHGAISLVEHGVLVFCVLTQESLCEKMLANMSEVKSRGGYLAVVTSLNRKEIDELADCIFRIPSANAHFTASLAILPLQLFSYYLGVARGLDVDKPRNLAKSVTVE